MEKKSRNKWLITKLKSKYRLVIMRDETFEEALSFRLTRMNVFVVFGTMVILLIVGTTFLIAFTNLKQYIPGYADVNIKKQLRELLLRTDSLEVDLHRKDVFITNLKIVLSGEDTVIENLQKPEQLKINYDTITITKSREDSLLRAEIEKQTQYNLNMYDQTVNTGSIASFAFFPPVKGIITNSFSIVNKHYGTDIVAPQNEIVKATLDGSVIFATWTLETGHIIAIQHENNIVSVYKHNSTLLKEQGSYVKAGEPIAIVGETGEFQTGPHLHFELWHNGRPINPEDYIVF